MDLKEARVYAVRNAFNTKAEAFICKVKGGYAVRASHNYSGRHVEVAELKGNVVILKDKDGKEISKTEKPKVKNTPKLSDTANEKSGKSVQHK